MCRSLHQGGRRCQSCGYNAKANGNRRQGRIARRKLVEHLLAEGLSETAQAVLHAPPSLVPVIMANLDLDSESILGDTPLPNTTKLTDALKAKADELSQMAVDERAGALGPTDDESAAQQAVAAAEEKVAAAEAHEDDLRKAANRATRKRRLAAKAFTQANDDFNNDVITADEYHDLHAAYLAAIDTETAAKADYLQAQQESADARAEAAIVGYQLKKTLLTEEEFDKYCAELTDAQIDGIKDAAIAASLHDAQTATTLSATPALHMAAKRDANVYTPGELKMAIGGEQKTVEGRLMDGGVAITRRGMGDFAILVDPTGEGVYHVVGTGSSKSDAIDKANRIPQFDQVPPIDAAVEAQNPLAAQAAKYKQEALIKGISKCVDPAGPSLSTGQDVLAEHLAGVPDRLTADAADAELAEINDGRRRHTQRLRVRNAEDQGAQARAAALASGLSTSDADAAYQKAYRAAMGSPTLGGGTIPHFDHKIPPDSLGQAQYTKLTHSGIRSFGAETAADYSIIADRHGDLQAWGFASTSGTVSNSAKIKTSDLPTLTAQHDTFINGTLSNQERTALTFYTGGSYREVNAAFTGRDENPSATIKGKVGYLRTAFEKYEKETPSIEPMTLMRGTKVPSGWKGTSEEYLNAVFKPGEKVQIGKITSATTNTSVAPNWTGHPPYIMVIRTRKGIPVRSISNFPSEDEVIVPPGSDLRCVRVDSSGIDGKPTVYLVAEDLVAEAQDGITNPTKKKAMAA